MQLIDYKKVRKFVILSCVGTEIEGFMVVLSVVLCYAHPKQHFYTHKKILCRRLRNRVFLLIACVVPNRLHMNIWENRLFWEGCCHGNQRIWHTMLYIRLKVYFSSFQICKAFKPRWSGSQDTTSGIEVLLEKFKSATLKISPKITHFFNFEYISARFANFYG